MTDKPEYIPGLLESVKFQSRSDGYRRSLATMKELGYTFEDVVQGFPAFSGHMTLIRFLSLYEMYMRTVGLSGHIAEVGVYKGAASILFAKLIQIFEPNSLTQVHGFDWFQGMQPDESDHSLIKASYQESEDRLRALVDCQDLGSILKIHNLDVPKELGSFLRLHPHLRFKLIFLDCGTYIVTKAALESLWPRLAVGGVLVLDQYNFELAPGETRAVSEVLPFARVETLQFGWMPTGFITKSASDATGGPREDPRSQA